MIELQPEPRATIKKLLSDHETAIIETYLSSLVAIIDFTIDRINDVSAESASKWKASTVAHYRSIRAGFHWALSMNKQTKKGSEKYVSDLLARISESIRDGAVTNGGMDMGNSTIGSEGCKDSAE